MNKRADGGLTAIVIVIIIIIFLMWLINVGQRECSSNKDCSDEEYCGSDFACHKIPVIVKENTPIVVQRNYVGPALIIGISLIIVAIIFNIDKIMPRRKKGSEESEERVYTNVPVYYEKHSSK